MQFRANGGPVSRGMPYIVGERGPELFMPRVNGQIISNKEFRKRYGDEAYREYAEKARADKESLYGDLRANGGMFGLFGYGMMMNIMKAKAREEDMRYRGAGGLGGIFSRMYMGGLYDNYMANKPPVISYPGETYRKFRDSKGTDTNNFFYQPNKSFAEFQADPNKQQYIGAPQPRKPSGGPLTAAFMGFRANGGSVSGMGSYVVGERGPEIFVPNGNRAAAPMQRSSNTSVVVNVNATGSKAEGDAPESKRLGEAIGAAVRQELMRQQRPGGILA